MEKQKKKIHLRIINEGSQKYGVHLVHQCSMGRQLGVPLNIEQIINNDQNEKLNDSDK